MKKLFFLLFFVTVVAKVFALGTFATNYKTPIYREVIAKKRSLVASGTIAVNVNSACLGGTSPFVTFTAIGGVATSNYTFVYTIGVVSQPPLVTTGTNSATLNVPTTTAGTLVYTLVSILEGSGTAVPITGQSVTITVNALPTITGDLNICDNSTSQLTGSETAALINPWTSSDLTKATISSTGLVTAVTPGTSNIIYTNSLGCIRTVVFTVKALPVGDFAFTNNQCSGSSVAFNSTATGTGPFTYVWTFSNGGTSSLEDPSHVFNAGTGNGTQNFIVTLIITNTITNCEKSITKTVSVKQLPDSAFDILNNLFYNPAKALFVNCTATTSSPNFLFEVANGSSTINTSYSIDWGDSTPITYLTNFTTINHLYTSLGLRTIILTTMNSSTGCETQSSYQLFNGNTPLGGLNNPGNVNDCVPYSVTWLLDPNTFFNAPGTTYSFSINDGSPPQNFTQLNLPTTITHQFNTTSCGFPGDSFTISFTLSNPCATIPQSIGIVRPALKPIASFTTNSSYNYCTNRLVTFTNTSIGNYIAFDACSNNFSKTWSITPNTGWTLNSGTIGIGSTNVMAIIFNNPGTYSISLNIRRPGSTASRCTDDTKTQTICVDAPLLPLYSLNKTESCTPAVITTTNTTDITHSCNPPTYLWDVQYAGGYCGSTPPTWSYTSGSATTANPSFSFVTPGTYSIKVTMTNSCGAVTSAIQTVIVKKPPTVAINAIPDFCLFTPLNATAAVNSCSPITSPAMTYLWTFTNGVPATSALQTPPAVNYAVTGNYTISLAVTNECGTTSDTETFNVKSAATIQNDSATLCSGGTFSIAPSQGTVGNIIPTGTAYSWGTPVSNPSGAISGGSAQSNQNTISQTLVNTTNTVATLTYSITPKSGICDGTVFTVIVTVNPKPVIATQSTAICSGSSFTISPINNAPSVIVPINTTYTWIVANPNGTGATSQNVGQTSISQTLTNETNAAVNVVYNVIASSGTAPNICTNTFNITVTVNPKPLLSAQTAITCNGSSFTVSLINNAPTVIVPLNTTYTWVVTNANGSGATSQSVGQSSISQVLTNATNTAINVVYNVTASSGIAPNICTSLFNVTVTVNPKPIIPTQNTIICSGSNFTILPINNAPTVIIPSGTTYSWVAPTITGITGSAAGSNQSSITGALTNTTNAPINVTYNVTATSGIAPNICSNTFNVIVTVNPNPFIANQTATTCSGTAFNVPLTNGPPVQILPVGTTFTWTVASVTGINGTSNQTTAATAISQVLTNITNAPIDVTYGVTASYGTSPNNCTSTFDVTVTVNPKPLILAQTITKCSGSSFTVTPINNEPTVIVPAGTTYTWTAPTVTGITGSVAGSNQSSITGNLTNTTNAPINVTYNITASSGTNPNNCTSTFNLTVTLNPSPSVIFSPLSQAICSGDNTTVVTLSSSTPNVTFSWTAANVTGITGIINSSITGSNTIPMQTLVNTTIAPITVTYNATATTASGVTCLGGTSDYTIIVKPKPVVGETFTPITCSGSTFTVTPNALATQNSIPTGTTYSWSAPSATGITGGTSGNNQTSISGTLTNITNTSINITYTVTPTSNGCSGATFTVVVTVNPKPVIASVTPAAICSGTSFMVNPTNGGTTIIPTGTTYTWIVSTNNTNITGQSDSAVAGVSSISQSLTNSSATAQSLTYTVTPTSGAAGACVGATFTISVTVNPKPAITDITPAAICSATAFSVNPANSGTTIVPIGTTYTWTLPVSLPVGAVTGGTAQTTGLNTISQTLSNTTNDSATLTYTVTPTSGSCVGSTFDVIVTVNPKPVSLSLTNKSFCNGVATTPIVFNNTVTGTTYAWTNSNPLIGLTATSGTGAIPVFTPTNAGAAAITSTISVTSTANGCSSLAETFTITVNPSPAVTFSPTSQSICSGDTTSLITLNSTTTGVTFAWTATAPTFTTGVITSGTTTIPSQLLTNSTNADISVTYNATATIAGGSTCLGAQYPYVIVIKPKPAITEAFTATACSGSAFTVTPATSTSNSIPTGTTYSWSTPSVTGLMTGGLAATNQTTVFGTLNNPTNSAQTATYTVTPSANGCSGTAFLVTVTVNPTPVIAAVTPAAICSGISFSVTPINSGATIVPTGTTYSWTVDVNTNITGQSASSATGVTTISQTLINGVNTPQSLIYTVTPTSGVTGNCVGTPFTITVIVSPKPTIADVTPLAICSGTFFSVTPSNTATTIVPIGTTYTWAAPVSTPIGAITGGSAQPTGQNSIGQLLSNTTNSTGTLDYTVTPTSGSCQGTPFHIIVTVNPIPETLSLTNLSYCNGVLTAPIVFSNAVTGTTYAWTNSNPLIGLTPISGVGDIPAFTATNGGATAITATLFVIATANGCSRAAETFTITVNPSPAVTFTLENQSICSGDSSSLVTLGSATAGATYSWTAVQPTGITGVTLLGTSTIPVQTLTNSTNAPITISYNATATIAGGATCAGAVYACTITVKPRPAITEVFTSNTCSGSGFTVTPLASALNSIPTGTTYSWSTPTVSGGLTGGASGTGQASITGTLINPTNTAQTATYTVTPSVNGCPGDTFTIVVTVNPKPVIANVTPAAICSGTSFTVNPTNGGTTIIPTGTTYTWIVSTNNTNITGQSDSAVAGVSSISQSLTNSSATAQSLTYTVTPTSGAAGACVGATFTISVTVNPKPAITDITPAAICSATAFSVTPANNSTTIVPIGTTYTWAAPVSTPIGAITGGSAQPTGQSSIGQLLSNTTNSTGTLDYTVTPTSGSCQGTPFHIIVTVNPIPVTLSLTNLSYCNGVLTAPIVFSNAVTGTTYAWTNSNPLIGLTPISGVGDIPAFTATNGGATTITATLSVIATANGCSRVADTFTITVNPSPTVTFTPTNQSICSGDSSALVTLGSATSGATYSWISVQPTGISGVTLLGNDTIPLQTLTNTTNAAIVVTYSATATIAGGATCAGAVYDYTITVKPRPAITEVFTANACSGSGFNVTPSASALNSIPAGTSYSWSIPTLIGGLTGGASGTGQSAITGTLNNPTNSAQTATYTVTPTANGCSGATFPVTVTVNPTPVIAAVTPAAICSGISFSVTPINSGATVVPTGTTYTWTVDVNTNITGQSASSATGVTTISQTLTNGVNTPQSLIYTVTPTSGDAGNCVGTPFTITVTVSPKPAVADVTPAAICSGTSFSVTPSNSGATIVPTGTTYTWAAPVSTPIGAITGGSVQPTGQSSIGQLLTNTTNSTGTLDYTVTPISGSCQGTPFHIIVTVNPIPGTLSLTNLSYCNGVLTAPIVFSNAVTGTTYAWTNSNPLIGLTPISEVGDIPAFTATNGGATAITATLFVIATANGCSRAAETFTITVNPSPAVTFTPTNQSICSGDSSALVTLGSATAGATYSWTSVQPTGISGVTLLGNDTIPVQTLTNSTNAAIVVTYSATATIAGGATCAGAVYDYTITVKPRPAIENQAITICNNQNFSIDPLNGIPSVLTIVPIGTLYTWTVIQNPNISGASGDSGALISQTLTNLSDTLQSIVYNVTPSYLNCNGNSFTITVNVNPTPNVIFSIPNQIICNNTQNAPINLNSNAVGTINYSWICNNPPPISELTGLILSGTTSTIPTQLLVNNSLIPIVITYVVSAEISGSVICQGPPSIYTITVNPTIITSTILTNYNSYNVSYFGGSDGAIDLTVSGGSGIYTYNWTGPISFISTSQDISNLVAGNYTVNINDGYCNPVTLNFTLTQPPELLIQETIAAHYNLLCFGDSNGTLGVTITQESVAPYDYQLLNSSGVVISFITNTNSLSHVFNTISAGIFSIKVIDANGGVKTISGLTLSQPNDIVITAATTPITCYGGNDASLILTVTGGTFPYTGSWDNLATGLSQNNLSAGTYTIVVKDANNCSKPITVIIPEAPIFTVNPVVANISCFGANDGSINLNFIGGIAPVVLTWSDGSTAGTTRNNLGPGTYSVIIRDSKPCYINKTFIIVEPQLLVLASNITNALDCNDANSGSINLLVSGGNPPFTYLWSNGATTEDLTNVVAGNYSVTVIDSKGCTKSAQYVISRPPPIILGVQTNTVFDCVSKIVKQTFVAQASGGVPSYIYNWSSGTVSGVNNEIMDTATNGMILLQATDAIGCSTNYTFNVDIPTLGDISFNSNSYAFATYGSYSINDPIQFTNIASGDFISVNWSFGDGTYSTELNPIHQYVSTGTYIITQTVTYPFGCVYNNVTSIIVGEGYALVIPNAFTPNNDALNAFFQPEYKGLSDFTLDVYDTWGELIYSEKGDAIRGWDGKVKGQDSENGNYYYKVSGKTFYGKIIEKQASFVLIK